MKDWKEIKTPEQPVAEEEKFKTFDKFGNVPKEEKYKTFDTFSTKPAEVAEDVAATTPAKETVKEEMTVIQTISNWSLMGEELMRKLAIGDTINLSIQRNNKNVWTFKEMPK